MVIAPEEIERNPIDASKSVLRPPAPIPEDWMDRALERVGDYKRFQQLGLIAKHGDFFPSVHYPPITMYPPIEQETLYKGFQVPSDGMLDIYAHLPFCNSHCVFCHYPVKTGEQFDEKERYMAAFEKEMDICLRQLDLKQIKARSVLVGGGTPTYLTVKQLTRFLKSFVQRIDVAHGPQFNYDVDPATLVGPEGRERLKLMREFGVNRLTIGVQSLDDYVLKLMARHHDAQTAIESIANCLEFGFQVNIEFIFGYPGETLENWLQVIDTAIHTGVHEIQLYRLKIDSYGDFQGAIKTLKQKNPDAVPSTDQAFMMKQLAIEMLAANGYHENLRRVYSKERRHYSHYAHNQCCELHSQIGLGLTAFSSMSDRFALNTASFEEYYRMIGEGKLPLNRGYVRNPEEQMRWSVVLPLKNRDVYKPRFKERTGASLDSAFRAKIESLKAFGLVREDEKVLSLTDLGSFFPDEICQQFHGPRFIPYPRSDYAEGPLNPYLNGEL
jgi:oxygen-independent coproporphyrinogen-3 oxidase